MTDNGFIKFPNAWADAFEHDPVKVAALVWLMRRRDYRTGDIRVSVRKLAQHFGKSNDWALKMLKISRTTSEHFPNAERTEGEHFPNGGANAKDGSQIDSAGDDRTPERTLSEHNANTFRTLSEQKSDQSKKKNKIQEEDTTTTVRSDAQHPSEPNEPVVVWIPIKGKNSGEHPVTESQVRDYQPLYPGIDVRRELAKCRQWNLDNPTRQKTARGVRRHITTWLENAQNKAARYPQQASSNQTGGAFEEILRQERSNGDESSGSGNPVETEPDIPY